MRDEMFRWVRRVQVTEKLQIEVSIHSPYTIQGRDKLLHTLLHRLTQHPLPLDRDPATLAQHIHTQLATELPKVKEALSDRVGVEYVRVWYETDRYVEFRNGGRWL